MKKYFIALLFISVEIMAQPSPLVGRALHYNRFSVYAKSGESHIFKHQMSGETDVWLQFRIDSLIVTDDTGRRGTPIVPVKTPNRIAGVMACSKTTRAHQIYQYYPNGRLRCIFEDDGYWWVVVFYNEPYKAKVKNFRAKMRTITNLARL